VVIVVVQAVSFIVWLLLWVAAILPLILL